MRTAVVSSDLGVMPSAIPGAQLAISASVEFKMARAVFPPSRTWNGDNGNTPNETAINVRLQIWVFCPGACSDDKVITEARTVVCCGKWSAKVDRSGKLVYPFSIRFVADTAIHCRAVLGQKGCGTRNAVHGSAQKQSKAETENRRRSFRDPRRPFWWL